MRTYTPFKQKMADISDSICLWVRDHPRSIHCHRYVWWAWKARQVSAVFASLAYAQPRAALREVGYCLLPRRVHEWLAEREKRRYDKLRRSTR